MSQYNLFWLNLDDDDYDDTGIDNVDNTQNEKGLFAWLHCIINEIQ